MDPIRSNVKKNEEDLKPMKKRVKDKIDATWLKMLKNTFWWTVWESFGPIISGTKYDTDNLIFSADRGDQSDQIKA